MSKLDELIKELCPNGVEYKTLGEVAIDIYRGSGITRDQVTDDGISCVRYGVIPSFIRRPAVVNCFKALPTHVRA